MLLPVLIISSLVHVFSVSYMSNDPQLRQMISYNEINMICLLTNWLIANPAINLHYLNIMLCLLDLVQIHIFGFVYDNYIVNEYFISSTSTESHTNGKIYKWYSTYLKGYQPTSQSSLSNVTAAVDNNNVPLDPWFIAGFVDGEGSFQISLVDDKRNKTGWRVGLFLSIGLHEKDRGLLELIEKTLGVGKISKSGLHTVWWRVCNLREIEKLIDFFKKYPLITQKYADFILMKKTFNLMKNKEHRVPPPLSREGDVMFIPPSLDREGVGRTSNWRRCQ